MQQIQAFRAADGTVFTEEALCLAHERQLKSQVAVAEFIKSPFNPYPKGSQASMAKATVLAWEEYKVDQAA